MKYVVRVYRNYATFGGRARRLEYWAFTAFWVAVSLVAALLMQLGPVLELLGAAALGIFVLGSLVPGLAVSVRRLHDIDRSGFWIFIAILPVIGGLVLFVLSLWPGARGSNRFGPDPKATDGAVSEVFA